MIPTVNKKSEIGKDRNYCSWPKRWSKKVDFFGQFSERLTNDPSIESSHRGEKDLCICSYSKNDSIAIYRRVNLKIVTFESSISPSSSKTRNFCSHILSFRALIYQGRLKLRANTTILNQKFRSVNAKHVTKLESLL